MLTQLMPPGAQRLPEGPPTRLQRGDCGGTGRGPGSPCAWGADGV